MKYMILAYGSQRELDALAGKPTDGPAWTAEEVAAMVSFMDALNKELTESGTLVETRGLAAPVHTRRVGAGAGAPVVTDGPYAETQEVLAGYWIVECDSFDEATAIAARLNDCPAPAEAAARAYVDVRPIVESHEELGF